MPGKHEGQGISPSDVIDYTQAVQTMYNVTVVVELKVSSPGTLGKWTIVAKSYEKRGENQDAIVIGSLTTYPSRHHKTLPGAILGAVMRLEQQLQGYYWLTSMGMSTKGEVVPREE